MQAIIFAYPQWLIVVCDTLLHVIVVVVVVVVLSLHVVVVVCL